MSCICDQDEHGPMEQPHNSPPPVQPSPGNGIKFSIENILGSSPTETERKPVFDGSMAMHASCLTNTASGDDEFCEDIDVNDEDIGNEALLHHDGMSQRENIDDGERFSWLHCTRYKPPKLPRSKRKDVTRKRKLGRNPRVPFTHHQVSILENKFRQTHYLSSVDVAELSAALNLTETRVKIWFQNRRARERRDKTSPELFKDHSQSSPFQEKSTHLTGQPFAANRVAPAEDHGVSAMGRANPLQSMLQSHWSYYQALQGLYCYRTLPTPFARSFQYYDATAPPHTQRGVVALRQSAFSPVTTEEEATSKTQVSM